MFLDLAPRMKSLYSNLEQYLHRAGRTFPSSVSVLNSFADEHFFSFLQSDIFSRGSRRKRKNQVPPKYYIINLKNICRFSSIKTFSLSHKVSFFFSMENNCNIMYLRRRVTIDAFSETDN